MGSSEYVLKDLPGVEGWVWEVVFQAGKPQQADEQGL